MLQRKLCVSLKSYRNPTSWSRLALYMWLIQASRDPTPEQTMKEAAIPTTSVPRQNNPELSDSAYYDISVSSTNTAMLTSYILAVSSYHPCHDIEIPETSSEMLAFSKDSAAYIIAVRGQYLYQLYS